MDASRSTFCDACTPDDTHAAIVYVVVARFSSELTCRVMASAMQTLPYRVAPRLVRDPNEVSTLSLTSSDIIGGHPSVAQLTKLFSDTATISSPESRVRGAAPDVSYSNDELYDLSIDTGKVPCVSATSFVCPSFFGVKLTDNSTRLGDSTFYYDLMDLAQLDSKLFYSKIGAVFGGTAFSFVWLNLRLGLLLERSFFLS